MTGFEILDLDRKVNGNNWWFAILPFIFGLFAFAIVFEFQYNLYRVLLLDNVKQYPGFEDLIPTLNALGIGRVWTFLAVSLCIWSGRKYDNSKILLKSIKVLGYIFAVLALILLFVPFYKLAIL